MEVIIIGISGVTCGGKTTLANDLKKLIPNSVILSQDEYCFDLKDPRHIWCKEVHHINFDVITGLDMDRMLKDLEEAIGNKKLLNVNPSRYQLEPNGPPCEYLNIIDKLKVKNVFLIILDGFLLFAHKPLLPFMHLKYFFTLDKEECFRRRSNRVYNPPDIPGYFETCVWPEYVKHLKEIESVVSDVTYFDNSVEDPLSIVIKDIASCL
ncbi:hypothetical protein HHI36_010762 [Cryptolaemus montrouzieri]|uniref:Nicotinamide riboside kinase 1 n=1 Tax=Cryptolaemus montrouzieri TaxID=559131 RepID=A0ABD2MJT6_9CUCU